MSKPRNQLALATVAAPLALPRTPPVSTIPSGADTSGADQVPSFPVRLEDPDARAASVWRAEVEMLARRFVPPVNDATIELEAQLYAHHPGRTVVPFYLWLSIRGHGRFDKTQGGCVS